MAKFRRVTLEFDWNWFNDSSSRRLAEEDLTEACHYQGDPHRTLSPALDRIPFLVASKQSTNMARQQQRDLAQRFINAQGSYDTDAMRATLDDSAKHDLQPASLGVGQTDNAGKIDITNKVANALGYVPVNVSYTTTTTSRTIFSKQHR